MKATSSFDVHAVNKTVASTDRFRSMENAIAALTTQIANLITLQSTKRHHGRSRSWSKSRSGNNNLCYYYHRFGQSANKCKPPCAYKSSENLLARRKQTSLPSLITVAVYSSQIISAGVFISTLELTYQFCRRLPVNDPLPKLRLPPQ